MSALASTEREMASSFVHASLETKDQTTMRALTSKGFTCDATWGYGKKIEWDNIEQMIGGFKCGIWSAKCIDFKYVELKKNMIEASHQEWPNSKSSTTYSKVTNVWTFTFTKEEDERKIQSVHIHTTVS